MSTCWWCHIKSQRTTTHEDVSSVEQTFIDYILCFSKISVWTNVVDWVTLPSLEPHFYHDLKYILYVQYFQRAVTVDLPVCQFYCKVSKEWGIKRILTHSFIFDHSPLTKSTYVQYFERAVTVDQSVCQFDSKASKQWGKNEILTHSFISDHILQSSFDLFITTTI